MSALSMSRSLRLAVSLVAFGALGLTGFESAAMAAPGHVTATQVADPPDPGDPGPDAVTSTEYNDGDTAYTPPGFGHAVEIRASVHYPTGLPDGPYPLIVLLHGRHSTCHSGSQAFGGWPCTGGATTIPSFQGYDYLAENLASWGYIVISISANGINAFDGGLNDGGALARAELVQKHLDKWKTFSTTGGSPFGSTFVGKVDMQNIGEMGHSRGGEGVVESYLYNKSLGSPYGIQAILPLAPIDFNRHVPTDVPMSVILPYCDGDVSDNQGIHFYDDSLYASPGDNTPKNYLEVMGANHNYFNTIWTPGGFEAGAFDDWGGGTDPICGSQSGSERLSAQQQRDVGLAYMAGFFRYYIGGETAMKPYFDGTEIQPASVSFADLHDAYQAPEEDRLTVDNFMVNGDLTTNLLGGAVTHKKNSPFDLCGGNSPQPPTCASAGGAQMPHTVGSVCGCKRGLSQLRFAWSSKKGLMRNAIPAADQDVSSYQAVSFRISQNISALQPDLNATVLLRDGNGVTNKVAVQKWSDAMFRPLGTTGGLTPKLILNTVRIPLSAFQDVDLTKITTVTLKFNKAKVGSVLMTDLAFND
jgi:hypothetical protein